MLHRHCDHGSVLTRAWRAAILLAVPLAAFTLAYLLSPLYGEYPFALRALPALFLIEAIVIGLAAAAILALVQRPSLFAISVILLAASAAFGVWSGMEIEDGQAAFPFLTPLYVGITAAVALGGLEWLLGRFGSQEP